MIVRSIKEQSDKKAHLMNGCCSQKILVLLSYIIPSLVSSLTRNHCSCNVANITPSKTHFLNPNSESGIVQTPSEIR